MNARKTSRLLIISWKKKYIWLFVCYSFSWFTVARRCCARQLISFHYVEAEEATVLWSIFRFFFFLSWGFDGILTFLPKLFASAAAGFFKKFSQIFKMINTVFSIIFIIFCSLDYQFKCFFSCLCLFKDGLIDSLHYPVDPHLLGGYARPPPQSSHADAQWFWEFLLQHIEISTKND